MARFCYGFLVCDSEHLLELFLELWVVLGDFYCIFTAVDVIFVRVAVVHVEVFSKVRLDPLLAFPRTYLAVTMAFFLSSSFFPLEKIEVELENPNIPEFAKVRVRLVSLALAKRCRGNRRSVVACLGTGRRSCAS